MNTVKNSAYRILPLLVLVALGISCKDEAEQLKLSRQFTPAAFEIESEETLVTVAWQRSLFTIEGEVEYAVEVAKDITFSNPEITTTTTETSLTFLDTEIPIKTDYFIRVKAVGKNGADDSNWLVSEAFRIRGESFVLEFVESDATADAALIKWLAGKDVAKIVFTSTTGPAIEVTVSELEKNAGEKDVTGLASNTNYTAELFNSEGVGKGAVTFTTKESYDGLNIIDLRSIVNRPKVLGDTLRQIPSGSVVLLKRGMSYTIDAADPATSRTLDRSVTIVSGDDRIPQFATIKFTTNFNIVAASIIDSLVFKDINVKGVRAAGASFDNDYILNVNVVGTIKKVRLENCKISRLRGVVRLQTAAAGAKIENYNINNCRVDSIREFAIVMASGGSSFANIKITNSTFSKCRRFIDHRVVGNNSIVIENCTFNELPTGAVTAAPTNYFIDFNAVTSANPVIIRNCIFGKTWIETVGNTDVGGIRGGAGTSVSVTNSYSLSDFVSTVEAVKLSGLLSYAGSSESVFTAPATGNFTIKDNAFPGRTNAGDPRWRQN
jgi:hypothetical protein